MAKGALQLPESRRTPRRPARPFGDIVDIRDIDWNRVWQSIRTARGWKRRDAGFWDNRAASFAEGATETQYADAFLALANPRPEWTVLDMGCGSGTLTVPLARIVSAVTAVDFSAGMIDVVRQRCCREGIANVTTIQASWEEDWVAKGVGMHDVAIASRSMVADDLHISVLKLSAVARKRVYIVTVVGDGPYDRRLFDAIGRPLRPAPDYIYTYNLLYQAGICANVNFIKESRVRTYEDIDAAAEALHWMVGDLSEEEKAKLAPYLGSENGNAASAFRHVTEITWAVLWWEKQDGRPEIEQHNL